MTCNLSTGDYTSDKLPGFGSVSLQDTAIFNAPAAITLQCGGINVIVTNAKLTAIKVDAIH